MDETQAGDSHSSPDLDFTNAPNLLTLSRILVVPLVVAALFAETPRWDWTAAVIFGLAAFTDYLDGEIARRRKLVTVYGKLMDPLADKFLVVSSLLVLQELKRIHPVANILLVCRELAVTSLRALASAEGVIIAAESMGKWKTGFQMAAIPMLMLEKTWLASILPLHLMGTIFLYLSLALSLWSAKDYAVAFFIGLAAQRKAKAHLRRQAREARIQARDARILARGRRPKPKKP